MRFTETHEFNGVSKLDSDSYMRMKLLVKYRQILKYGRVSAIYSVYIDRQSFQIHNNITEQYLV